MNTFRQHVPAFVDVDAPPTVEFDTVDELLAIDTVQSMEKIPGFTKWAIDGNCLLAVYDDGYRWWVAGYLGDPSVVDLPQWEGWKFHARLKDGKLVDLGKGDIVSSCGYILTLRDGSTATEIRS